MTNAYERELEEAQARADRLAEMQDRRDEQARWERFFAAALQGCWATLGGGATWDGVKYAVNPAQIVATIEAAVRLTDEAVRVADVRAEERRGKGGAL